MDERSCTNEERGPRFSIEATDVSGPDHFDLLRGTAQITHNIGLDKAGDEVHHKEVTQRAVYKEPQLPSRRSE